jgi:nucleotide-binding universal stress UspA family protein
MPEAILVLLRDQEETPVLLGAAARMRQIMARARINALAVRETFGIAPERAATLTGRAEALLAAEEAERQRFLALRASFERWSATAGQAARAAQWFEAEGRTTEIVARWGRRADIVVVGRPSPEDRLGRASLRSALLGTDRPILMVPPRLAPVRATFGRRILMLWGGEKPSLRAALAALRWFADAEQVHVLIGASDAGKRRDIASLFSEHGLAASLHLLAPRPGPIWRTLLETAWRLSADLLIMSASPLGGVLLRGVTRHVIAEAELPVLMRR